MALSQIVGGLATAALKRTYLLESTTFDGVPRLLLVFDAITSEQPTYEADVTEVPVEDSTKEITDHIQRKNPKLSLQGTISQTPLDLSTAVSNLLSGGVQAATSSQFRQNFLNTGVQALAGVAGAALQGNAGDPGAAFTQGFSDAIARSILIDAYERRARFNVVTQRQQFENMVIQKMTFPRDSNTGDQLIFQLELKQLRIVKSITVTLDTVSEDVVTSATNSSNLGKQAAGGLSEVVDSSARGSTLAKLDDLTGRTISGLF